MSAPLAHGEPLTERRLYYSLWLLELCAALAAVSTGGNPITLLFWAALFAFSLGLGADYAQRPTTAKRKRGEYVAVAGMAAFLFSLFTANLPSALVVLVLWLQAALNTTLSTRRHGYFALAVSFVVVLFAASLSKSGLFLLIGIGYALAAMYALLLLHAEAIRQRSVGVAVAPRRRLPASVVPLTAAVLTVAGLLYLFMPRPPALMYGAHLDRGGVDYRNSAWEREAQRPGREPGGRDGAHGGGNGAADHGRGGHGAGNGKTQGKQQDYAGFSDRFDIDARSHGKGLYNGILLYVQAPQPLYLQGRVFDTFDGLSWHASRHRRRMHLLEHGDYRYAARDDGPTVHQVITVAHTLPPIIPAAPQVEELRFPGTVFAEDSYGTLTLPRRLAKGTEYEVFSRRRYVQGHPVTPGQPDELAPYLQLPPHMDPRIGALAARVIAGSASQLGAALALEHYLRTHYHYTFATIPQQNHIPLATFLFDTKRGHCEYFATAMTIMLRTQGIPARLVTGFSATNYNPLTGYYEVRGLDGHAWTEAYLPRYGWVTFEPTAFYDLPKPKAPTTTAQALDNYVQRLKSIAEQGDPKAGSTGVLAAIAGLFTLIRQALAHLLAWLRTALVALGPSLLLIGTVVTLLGWGLYTLRRPLFDRWGGRRVARAAPAAIAWVGFREMEGWFARRGNGREAGETVEEYARRLATDRPQQAKAIRRIAGSFVQQRYGALVPDAAEAEAIREAFVALTVGVSRSAPR